MPALRFREQFVSIESIGPESRIIFLHYSNPAPLAIFLNRLTRIDPFDNAAGRKEAGILHIPDFFLRRPSVRGDDVVQFERLYAAMIGREDAPELVYDLAAPKWTFLNWLCKQACSSARFCQSLNCRFRTAPIERRARVRQPTRRICGFGRDMACLFRHCGSGTCHIAAERLFPRPGCRKRRLRVSLLFLRGP